jgi:3-isopropylmalate/(R)-2-methylmalate dehydratase large subunit
MSQKAKNIIEKIWERHVVFSLSDHPALFAIDLMLLHEVTSAQAFDLLREKKLDLYDRDSLVATLDHSIPTRKNRLQIFDQSAKEQVEKLRSNAKEFGVPLYDFESGHQGIVHVIGPELGLTQPGITIVCGDSHTSTHGAFAALAFGVGTSEVGHVLATGCLLLNKPKTMQVEFQGRLKSGVYSKDCILKLISLIGVGGANGHVIEYCGETVAAMSIEERLTLCNMSIECGARAGLVAPDEVTYQYIKGRKFAPKTEDWERAVNEWRSLVSDPGATYDKKITINVNQLEAMVTWGTNPAQALEISGAIPRLDSFKDANQRSSVEKALAYVKLAPEQKIAGTRIEWAFLGSCTNGRIEDLRIAAKIIEGKQVAGHVKFYVVPGSEAVKDQAEKEGLDKIFIAAGADWRMPGCSMCLGMNDDKVPAGERCISSSNRNFVGRQGTGSITHLASPATVTASAIKGEISPAN